MELRNKNDSIAEACLLQNYKGLVFADSDSKITFSVCDKNMEYRRGVRNGWFVIAVCAVEGVEDEPFALELACELIGETSQVSGVKVIRSANEK